MWAKRKRRRLLDSQVEAWMILPTDNFKRKLIQLRVQKEIWRSLNIANLIGIRLTLFCLKKGRRICRAEKIKSLFTLFRPSKAAFVSCIYSSILCASLIFWHHRWTLVGMRSSQAEVWDKWYMICVVERMSTKVIAKPWNI